MAKSEFVCSRCGLSVHKWGESWKHSANGHTQSCRKPPVVMRRRDYEERGLALVDAARAALKR